MTDSYRNCYMADLTKRGRTSLQLRGTSSDSWCLHGGSLTPSQHSPRLVAPLMFSALLLANQNLIKQGRETCIHPCRRTSPIKIKLFYLSRYLCIYVSIYVSICLSVICLFTVFILERHLESKDRFDMSGSEVWQRCKSCLMIDFYRCTYTELRLRKEIFY